ncbi:SH3 domain-containing protein C23A1.17-like [Tachyglossus aculeatus]|uniref:SH3 domain-containing protein C23A1.17-like n=1 Tax=Tachyglossus aculeatus TaxID=9261 RepID=UPI0018F7827E|nr:SH3 domain-containing protein C23A1.17-like [Tachyglossus aculeatus]
MILLLLLIYQRVVLLFEAAFPEDLGQTAEQGPAGGAGQGGAVPGGQGPAQQGGPGRPGPGGSAHGSSGDRRQDGRTAGWQDGRRALSARAGVYMGPRAGRRARPKGQSFNQAAPSARLPCRQTFATQVLRLKGCPETHPCIPGALRPLAPQPKPPASRVLHPLTLPPTPTASSAPPPPNHLHPGVPVSSDPPTQTTCNPSPASSGLPPKPTASSAPTPETTCIPGSLHPLAPHQTTCILWVPTQTTCNPSTQTTCNQGPCILWPPTEPPASSGPPPKPPATPPLKPLATRPLQIIPDPSEESGIPISSAYNSDDLTDKFVDKIEAIGYGRLQKPPSPTLFSPSPLSTSSKMPPVIGNIEGIWWKETGLKGYEDPEE